VRPAVHVSYADADVRELLAHDLRERFGTGYGIAAHAGGEAALAALRRDAQDGRRVAVVVSDESPTGGPEDLLAAAHDLHPRARRVLLVGRGEWSNQHPAVEAMRRGQADSYIFVPWGPRERWLYLPLAEALADWEQSQPPEFEAARIVGNEFEPRAHALRDTLSRVGVPFGFYAADSAQGQALLTESGVDAETLPVVVFRSGRALVDPSFERLATALGFATEPHTDRCDLVIVGAGPAGLAAAVYAASEGLETCVIESAVPGGQAGTSSRIRNYLGFPNGVSGRDLASRAIEQAWFFGARFVLSKPATGIRPSGAEHVVQIGGQAEITARTVLIATGVSWHRLEAPALDDLLGAGVYYGAAPSDAPVDAATVFVVGGGNSAGQAAVHLARSAASVTLVVRGGRLGAGMSDYLVRELDETPNIHVRLHTEVVGARGGGRLTSLTLRDGGSGTLEEAPADAVYVMIGARPQTGWLSGAVARDEQGYVFTGRDVTAQSGSEWPLERPPMLFETSRPGIFAAGDVRHGSIKRVASAVGGGSIAVQLVHMRLAELA